MLPFLWSLIACDPSSGHQSEEPCEHAFYADADSDGHGDPTDWTIACEAPSGFVATADDCDDSSASVHPGSVEVCDGLDDDCDGSVDVDAADAGVWFVDRDADGFGDDATETRACDAPAMHVDIGGDCDDDDATIHPDAVEICDELDDDCDGFVDAADADLLDGSIWHPDVDGDHLGDAAVEITECAQPVGAIVDGSDCNDADATIHPGREERCDEIDNDCDGLTDDEDDALTDAPIFHVDADGDGFGDRASTIDACVLGPGMSESFRDCDDTDASIGEPIDYWSDGDGDGYGREGTSPSKNCDPEPGWGPFPGDCNDGDASINPGATETCDEVDDNCDGLVDEEDPGLVPDVWYADGDGDGYGDDADVETGCDQPIGYLAFGGDCDPSSVDTHPGALEQCDGIDNDCDGSVDDDVVYSDWYEDDDGDGYGVSSEIANDCVRPIGYAAQDGDCDDAAPTTSPGAIEACGNDADDDCDGIDDNCTIELESALATVEGRHEDFAPSQDVGMNIAVGDLDGDGVADLVLGGELEDSSALIVPGPLSGASLPRYWTQLTDTVAYSHFGRPAETGDADGDGQDDVLIGAYWYDPAYLFLGPVTAEMSTDEADGAYDLGGGDAIELIADFDGDAAADVALGAPDVDCPDRSCGVVYVLPGSLTGEISVDTQATYRYAATETRDLGQSLASLGDMDGDGTSELAIGAGYNDTTDDSVIYVVSGGADPGTYDPVAAAGATINAVVGAPGDLEGGLTGADYDGDGATDLFVGSPNGNVDDAGVVLLFYGPITGELLASDAAVRWDSYDEDTRLGPLAVGDFDGDRELDVAMGAPDPHHLYAQGAAWVQIGKTSGVVDLDTLVSFANDEHGEFGTALATIPDWDGDGGDELAIGAPKWLTGDLEQEGKVWIFSSELF
jgi:hypothetical protein